MRKILGSAFLKLLLVTYIFSLVCSQVSQPVCQWNENLGSCNSDTQGLLDLLTSTNSIFANMMRCSLTTSVFTCTTFLGNSCIWDNNSCRISSSYLVDSITQCFDKQQTDNVILEECTQQLYDIKKQYSYIDQDTILPAKKCSGISSDAFLSNTSTCDLLGASLDCNSNRANKCYVYKNNTLAHKLGYNLQSNLKYLMGGELSGKKVLGYSYLQQKLNIYQGNLQKYDQCTTLPRQDCISQIGVQSSPSYLRSPSPSYFYYRSSPSPSHYYYSNEYSSFNSCNQKKYNKKSKSNHKSKTRKHKCDKNNAKNNDSFLGLLIGLVFCVLLLCL